MNTASLLQTGRLEKAPGAIPEILIPSADCFTRRSQRLAQLAPGHNLEPYLRFLAALTNSQQRALEQAPSMPLPDKPTLLERRRKAVPLLPFSSEKQNDSTKPHWQGILPDLVDAVIEISPAKGRDALNALLQDNSATLQSYAAFIAQKEWENLNPAIALIIAAALQVQWTALVQQSAPHIMELPGAAKAPRLCPVCGALPSSSIIHTQGSTRGLRYLHCSLCNCQWHVVRAKCSQCDNTKGIIYLDIQEKNWPVQAEACPNCAGYLKLCRLDQNNAVDPLADDLASLALDLLMTEKGFAASGINFFLFPGKEN